MYAAFAGRSELAELKQEFCHLSLVNLAVTIRINACEHCIDIRILKHPRGCISERVTDKITRIIERQIAVLGCVIVIPDPVDALIHEAHHKVIFAQLSICRKAVLMTLLGVQSGLLLSDERVDLAQEVLDAIIDCMR